MPKHKTGRRRGRKLTKAERRVIALRNLAKAHRGHGRFKKKRVGLVRTGKKRTYRKRQVLTVSESRRTSRRKSHRKSPKRVAAGKKAARTRKRRRNPVVMEAAPRRRRKRKSSKRAHHRRARRNPWPKGKSRKRSNAARKAARTRKRNKTLRATHRRSSKRRKTSGHRKSPKRVAAGRKAARTRKAHRRASQHYRRPETKLEREYAARGYAYEGRRRRRHRRRNPFILPNPMTQPMELAAKLAGFGFGYLLADGVDRYAATHALTTDSSGNVTDNPAAGQIYDSEAVALPIWSSPMRLGMNAAAVALPFFLSKFLFKEFMLHAGIAAVVRTVGKAATDAVATYAPANAMTLQLYGDTVAANARLTQASSGLPSTQAGMFAGTPRRQMAGRPVPPRQLAAAPRRIGDCSDPSIPGAIMTDPLSSASDLTNQTMPGSSSSCGCDNGFNPLLAGVETPTDGTGNTWFMVPTPSTPSTSTTTTTTSSSTPSTSTTTCTAAQIASMQASLTALQAQIDNPNTSPLGPAYSNIYAQLVACGVTPNNPSLTTMQATYNAAMSNYNPSTGKPITTSTTSNNNNTTPR